MTRAERLAELRGRAWEFRCRGLHRFAAECDRLTAALVPSVTALRARPVPGRPADVITLPRREPNPSQLGADP